MKKGIFKKIGLVSLILLSLIILWILFVNLVFQDNDPYLGGYAPDGSYCDYGYSQGTEACCDEDDYSCMVCDVHGIYCYEEHGFQFGFYDIEHFPEKVSSGDYSCSDFNSWEEAQKVFVRDGGAEKDPYELDEDEDGIACESLKN